MAHYLVFDSFGFMLGRYKEDIHGDDIPTDAIQVSEALFRRTINETDGIWKHDPATGEIAKYPFPEPRPTVPETVSRAQGKAALITAGLWLDVLAWADKITDPVDRALTDVALHDTLHWRRDSPILNA